MIAERSAQLVTFCAEHFDERRNEHARRTATGSPDLTDDEVIARCRDAANGAKFMRLWAGDTSGYGGDDSAADLALLSILAFWTQDAAQLDRLFRRSGLMREKWERADYRQRTIAKAIDRREIYEPAAPIVRTHRIGTGANADAGQSSAPGRNGNSAHADAGKGSQSYTIAEVAAAFQKWLYLPNNGPVYATLGAVAANLQDSDPVWLLNVGSSSGGKTEIVNAISRLPDVHLAATLTEASLLSGTPKKDAAAGSKGGLLRDIGDFGILALKDFTSILSMNRDPRAQLLAALREIYDGNWTRYVGSEGGKTLAWSGKLGLIGGCTAAIDDAHSVLAVMGERFLLHRLPVIDAELQADRALDNAGHVHEMREELSAVVRGLFAGLTIAQELAPIDQQEKTALIALSALVAASRSGVIRDGYKREVDLIMDTEAPARLAQTLRRLYSGMLAIGLPRDVAWPLVAKTGLDTMPKLRRAAFDALLPADDGMTTTTIATQAGYPTTTARRSLEDMAAHGVVTRMPGGKGNADIWRLSDVTRARYATAMGTVPDLSVAKDASSLTTPHRIGGDKSGTVQFSAPPCGESGETPFSRCWHCKAVIDNCERCPACEWMMCPSCGACERGCDAAPASVRADEEEHEEWKNTPLIDEVAS